MRPTDAPTERYAAQSAKYEADLNADVQAILNQPSGINVKGLIDAVPMPSYAPGASADSDFAGYEWADQFGNGKPNLDLARVRYVQGGPRKSADAAEAAGYQRELEDFNRANGWYNDGLVMRMMPRKGPSDTGQRLEPRTGDGLLSSERYLRDNGFIDPRAGTLEYDVGRRLIEDIGIAGAPEAAIGLIPARVTAAASRYMGAAGEFVLGEQRMAKLALAGEMRAGLQFGDATLGQGYGSASSLYLDDSTNLLTFRASSMYSPSNSDLSRLALDGFKRSGEPVFRTGEGLAASEFERAFGGMLDRITPDSWPHPNPPDFMIKGGQYDGKTVDFLYVKTRLVINTFNE